MAKFLEKVLDIWPWKAVQGFEAERGVLCDARTTEQLGSAAALGNGDVTSRALDFGD